jgi:hypothetical protein
MFPCPRTTPEALDRIALEATRAANPEFDGVLDAFTETLSEGQRRHFLQVEEGFNLQTALIQQATARALCTCGADHG